MQKLLKQVHSENHTMVTVASPNDDFIFGGKRHMRE